MNIAEAADETLKRIARPGYICFAREKRATITVFNKVRRLAPGAIRANYVPE